MPIYHDDAGHPVIHLGHGDIVVALGQTRNKCLEHRHSPEECPDELLFLASDTPHAVGAPCPELDGTLTHAGQIAVRIVFDNVAAVDVVLEKLAELRQGMEA